MRVQVWSGGTWLGGHHEEGGQEEPQAGRGRHPQAGLHPGRDLGQGEAAEPRG